MTRRKRKTIRVDFREMPAYTRPENYEYRRYNRSCTDIWEGEMGGPEDYDLDDPSLWDMPGNPSDYGDN